MYFFLNIQRKKLVWNKKPKKQKVYKKKENVFLDNVVVFFQACKYEKKGFPRVGTTNWIFCFVCWCFEKNKQVKENKRKSNLFWSIKLEVKFFFAKPRHVNFYEAINENVFRVILVVSLFKRKLYLPFFCFSFFFQEIKKNLLWMSEGFFELSAFILVFVHWNWSQKKIGKKISCAILWKTLSFFLWRFEINWSFLFAILIHMSKTKRRQKSCLGLFFLSFFLSLFLTLTQQRKLKKKYKSKNKTKIQTSGFTLKTFQTPPMPKKFLGASVALLATKAAQLKLLL